MKSPSRSSLLVSCFIPPTSFLPTFVSVIKSITMQDRYSQRGVSATKEEVHQAIQYLDKGLFPKAFCKIVPDILGGDSNYCNVMHADGAGSKSSLAYLYWRETGDISVWRGIAQDAVVMNTRITIKKQFFMEWSTCKS